MSNNAVRKLHVDVCSKCLCACICVFVGRCGVGVGLWAPECPGSSRLVLTLYVAYRRSARTEPMNVELSLARSLAIGCEHIVIRCRLDFLTNRQLRKLRTLAELRLAAVSSLQHCAITLVRNSRCLSFIVHYFWHAHGAVPRRHILAAALPHHPGAIA